MPHIIMIVNENNFGRATGNIARPKSRAKIYRLYLAVFISQWKTAWDHTAFAKNFTEKDSGDEIREKVSDMT